MAHQCPGARTPLLREPRFSEGNEKGSRKEEMDEEKGSRGEQRLCSFPLCSGSLPWPLGPGLLPQQRHFGTLSFTRHSAIKLCAFPQPCLWLFPLSVPSVQNTLPSPCVTSSCLLFRPQFILPWHSDLPNDQPAQGVATTLSVHFPSHPRLCCPSPFLFCARMVSISLPSLEYELSEKRDLVVWISTVSCRHWLPG